MQTDGNLEPTDTSKVAANRIARYVESIPELMLLASLVGARGLVMAAAELVLFECSDDCGDRRCWARDIWGLLPKDIQDRLRVESKEVLDEHRKSLN